MTSRLRTKLFWVNVYTNYLPMMGVPTNTKEKVCMLNFLSQIYLKPGDSHFWAGIMATKKYFIPYGSFSIKDVSKIRFWEDK
jgi:hypothetical protein